MKLSARSRYASRILLELAKHMGASPMSAATLSNYTGVSVQFVEQILKPLKQNGLTHSVRGAAGGHRLARPADQISLGEVVRLMEGGITLTVCCGEKANECPRRDGCLTRRAWVQLSTILEKELDSISLATLLQHGDAVCPEGPQRTERGSRKPVAAPEAPARGFRTIIRKAKGLRR
ncbi:MAG: Rrf2 family transcriptional regulator [Desulfovibrionaceae bacterium]|nr:Rrf2 family transcriptional regulator [Desulfovibrionaceae bacterium]